MKVFCFKHEGVWIPGYSVVMAEDEQLAKNILRTELQNQKLFKGGWMELIGEIQAGEAKVLFNGDY